MRLRVGIDHVEIARIAKALQNPRFLPRFFGSGEILHLESKGVPPASVAAGFCAKEAFGKALGTGVRNFKLSEVELLREDSGRPYLAFTGAALKLARESGLEFEVSISHDKHYALAQVVGIGL